MRELRETPVVHRVPKDYRDPEKAKVDLVFYPLAYCCMNWTDFVRFTILTKYAEGCWWSTLASILTSDMS